MKIGGKVEGSPQEIHDLFQNQGMNLAQYLEAPESPIATMWLIIPSALYGAAIVVLPLCRSLPQVTTLLFFGSLVIAIWTCIAFYLRWKSGYITVFVAVAALLLSCMAAGIIEAVDALKLLKESKPKE